MGGVAKCVSTCVCLACQESSLPPTITWQDLQLLNEPFNACYWHFLGLFAVNVILTLLRESPTMMWQGLRHLVNWCTHCEWVGWDTCVRRTHTYTRSVLWLYLVCHVSSAFTTNTKWTFYLPTTDCEAWSYEATHYTLFYTLEYLRII